MAISERISSILGSGRGPAVEKPIFPARDVIAALYVAAIGIKPTEEQLEEDLARLTADPLALDAFAAHLRERAQSAMQSLRPLSDHSQFGELGMLLREFAGLAQTHGIIVDLGANSRNGSNSYDLLADFGWKGVLIEANPALIDGIRSDFDGLDYVLVDCAVGLTTGRQTLHLGIGDQISSLDPALVLRWGESFGGVEVDVRRLDDILREHRVPHDFDVLSIDVEGLDAEILNDLVATSEFRPRWIVAEVAMPLQSGATLADTDLSPLFISQYELVNRTLPNLILRRR